MRERIQQFRKSAELENQSRERRRYSPDLRQEAMAIFAARRREGASVALVAAELGLAPVSFGRWQQKGKKVAASVPFRRVEVVQDARVAGSGFRLLTPRGFVVEGLDFTALMSLWSVL